MKILYSARCARCNGSLASDDPIDGPVLCDPCLEALDLDDGCDEEVLSEYDLADLAMACDSQILKMSPRKRGA